MAAGGRNAWLLRLCVAALVLAVFEGASAVALRLLERKGVRYEPLELGLLDSQRQELLRIARGQPVYLDHDAALGWSPRPGGESGLYRANAAGLRDDRDHAFEAPAGVVRVAAFGDSYVHGDEVELKATWERQLESLIPGIEVLNFGVSGYGIDQAFLRYQSMGRRYRPRIVLIGFMTDDLARAVSTFRLFQYHESRIPLAKPRFVLENGALRLLPNPFQTRADYEGLLRGERAVIARLGADDAQYQTRYHSFPLDALRSVRVARLGWLTWRGTRLNGSRLFERRGFYRTQSEAFALNLALLETFVATVKRDGAVPLVVFFPGRWNATFAERSGDAPYAPLRQALVERGVPALDLIGAFREAARAPGKELYLLGHYSPAGNRIAAEAIAPRLAALARGTPGDAVDQAGSHEAHEATQAAAQR